jgi:AcrR family transcriptional regulator
VGLTPKGAADEGADLGGRRLGCLLRGGYEATTMRDVAREAGAGLGLAYRYFASKEEFALALYMRLAEESEEWARDELVGGTVADRFVVKLD